MLHSRILPPVLLAFSFLQASQTLAESDTPVIFRADGHTLLAECGEVISFLEAGIDSTTGMGASYCLGMVSGMLNLNTIYQAQQQRQLLFCPPRNRVITNAEAARTVVEYLQAHPERLNLDHPSLMFFAFEDAWPCP